MESKEFLLKKYEGLIKRVFNDRCCIMPHNVHVEVYESSNSCVDQVLIMVKIPSHFSIFPEVLDKVVGMPLCSLSLSGDKRFFSLVYLCQ